MLAAFLEKPGVVTLRTISDDPLMADDVRVRIMASGVCGSDVHFFEHGRIGPFVPEGPLILGHEAAGVVEEAGAAVKGVKVGDRVSLEPGVPCFQCETCKRGLYNICSHVTFLGSPPLVHGTFRERMVHHHAMVHILPGNLSYEEGALIEPLSVAVYSCRLGAVSVGDLVAVIGAGPIGLLIAQVARACGASVIACEVNATRLQAAGEMGAEQIINPAKGDPAQAIAAKWGRAPNVVFEAAGAVEGHQLALELADRGGRVVFVGWSRNPDIPLNVHLIGSKELSIRGQFRYRNVFPEAIALASSGRVDLKSLITRKYALKDVPKALLFASQRKRGTIKVVVTPDGR